MQVDAHAENTRYSGKFLYVRNDPVNLVDPDGQSFKPICYNPEYPFGGGGGGGVFYIDGFFVDSGTARGLIGMGAASIGQSFLIHPNLIRAKTD